MKCKRLKIFTKSISTIICAFLIVSTGILYKPTIAHAYETAKAHTWKANIIGNVNTDGTVEVRENRIVDITPFVEKAKTAKSPAIEADVQTIKTERLKPVVWNFGGMPEESTVEVTGINYNLLTENDLQVGKTRTINPINYDKKYNGNTSPSSEAYTYYSEQKQVLSYLFVSNSEALSPQEAAAVMTSLTGNSDPATWTSNRINLVFSYKLYKAVLVYKDVADFTWIYASDGWLMNSYNVEAMLNIPVGTTSVRSVFDKIKTDTSVELNATPVDQNIYAWGHGSANGVVNLDPNGTVTLKDDIVPARTNAELRVAFPSSWLTNLGSQSELSYTHQTKLSSILKEESVWHDSKSKEVLALLFFLIVLGLSIVLILILLIFVHLYKQKFQTQTLDEENIHDLHPCTILRLRNWNREHPHDITENILFLEDCEIIKVTQHKDGNYALTLTKPDYINADPQIDMLDDIDINTINLLFNHINKGKTTITTDDIYNYAKARSHSFLQCYNNWHLYLKEKTRKLAGFKTHHKSLRRSVYVAGLLLFIVALVLSFLTQYPQTAVVGGVTWIVMSYIANSMRNKIIIASTNGQKIAITDISMTINPNKKEKSDFKIAFDKVLETSVRKAQENIQYITAK